MKTKTVFQLHRTVCPGITRILEATAPIRAEIQSFGTYGRALVTFLQKFQKEIRERVFRTVKSLPVDLPMLEKMFRRTFMSPQKCGICGKKELFLMLRYVKDKAPKLCKKCYDQEIDEQLSTYPVLK